MKKLLFVCIFTFFSHASEFWKKEYLFDEATLTYYIPFELWLEVPWDGQKKQQFHTLKDHQNLSGFYTWYHPYLQTHLNVYKSNNKKNNILYTLYSNGIATVYNEQKEAYYNNGIFFPAGFGWKINKLYSFSQEMWKHKKKYSRNTAIVITDISFDEKSNFKFLTYNFFINGKLQKSYKILPKKK